MPSENGNQIAACRAYTAIDTSTLPATRQATRVAITTATTAIAQNTPAMVSSASPSRRAVCAVGDGRVVTVVVIGPPPARPPPRRRCGPGR